MSRIFTLVSIGIAIGILIAPDKGSVTRRKLADLFDDLTDDASDTFERGADRAHEAAEDLGSEVERTARGVRNWD